jgi:ferredoxin
VPKTHIQEQSMALRKIIEIDRDLCDGCGLCTTACDEGALALDEENKAYLVHDLFCDGMGVCLDVCPTGALKIIEREGDAYDPEATRQHVLKTRGAEAVAKVYDADATQETDAAGPAPSELTQWPVQLHLVSPFAPWLQGADLLIAADCTAFTRGSFHRDLLKGRKLVIACPKLDNTDGYVEKLADIIRMNALKSLTVAVMTVPCCTGLIRMVQRAIAESGVDIPMDVIVIGIEGEIVEGDG